MKDKDQPWLGESSYGDEPQIGQGDILSYDEKEWALRQRNQKMVRAGDGYINRRGIPQKIRTTPAVIGRQGEMLDRLGE